MKERSILVIFGKDRPQKNQSWFEQFDEILESEKIDELIDPGSVQQAYDLVNKVSRITLADGSRLSKSIDYRGYELWWMHYDDIYYYFCLPYTQYRRLLSYLNNFGKITIFRPPASYVFKYFLSAVNRQCVILKENKLKDLLPIPFGVFMQAVLSFLFLPWLAIRRPGIMLWASDKFAPPHDYDFRMRFIYEELRRRKTHFVEFIRSMESWPVVLRHAWRRKRPVFYSVAIILMIKAVADSIGSNNKPDAKLQNLAGEERFLYLAGCHYLGNVKGDIAAIGFMKFILKLIGIKAAVIDAACNRTFYDVLGCKLAGIKIVGIQHGAASKYYFVSDFMPEFDGGKMLSVDRYGVWSEGRKEYYLKNSRAYKSQQLFVSGMIRPLEKEIAGTAPVAGLPKVLFISEEIASPKEILPYLSTILETNDFDLYFKFRPYKDGFEIWLKKNSPEVYRRILEKTKVLRGTMEEAIRLCDIVVGSYSTAVLEALLQMKPFVFFQTQKWGDAFEIKELDTPKSFFAENPEELIRYIKSNLIVSKEEIKKLQQQFFGNPYQDGGKWVVEQVLEFAKNHGK